MSDLTDTLRLIARAGAGQKQLVLDHYRTVLLEAQRDYDAQELTTADPGYRLWMAQQDTRKD